MKFSKEMFRLFVEERGYSLSEEKIESLITMVALFENDVEKLKEIDVPVNEPVTKFIAREETK
ncbi:hypothetical protein [Ferviditalea candida]|uniref:Uncharacterized protein n=1 Tax=Ferviditalea candida TaxID=3108399 RepID=A0ABU5ZGZ3_9BACL|nr:hypothetical protein [Paenibacillaceae bacterium T2]